MPASPSDFHHASHLPTESELLAGGGTARNRGHFRGLRPQLMRKSAAPNCDPCFAGLAAKTNGCASMVIYWRCFTRRQPIQRLLSRISTRQFRFGLHWTSQHGGPMKSMHAAIAGCERLFFGMSVTASYLETTVNAAAVARHQRHQGLREHVADDCLADELPRRRPALSISCTGSPSRRSTGPGYPSYTCVPPCSWRVSSSSSAHPRLSVPT
jgi:hypothetical protein